MSIGSINTERSTWGAASQNAKLSALGGNIGGFEETLKSSVGFGSKSDSGQVTESIAGADLAARDLVSQLQFSLLKSESSGGVSSRLNNALF